VFYLVGVAAIRQLAAMGLGAIGNWQRAIGQSTGNWQNAHGDQHGASGNASYVGTAAALARWQ